MNRTWRHIYLLLIFFSLWSMSNAQFNFANQNQESEIDFLSNCNEWKEIGGDITYALTQDNLGFIWFASTKGLGRFDGSNFQYYKPNFQNSKSIVNGPIETIHSQPKQNRVFIGYQNQGLHIFNLANESVTQYHHKPNDSLSLSRNRVVIIFEDRAQRIWIITDDDVLHLFDEENKTFSRFENPIHDQHAFPIKIRQIHMIQDIIEAHIFWISNRYGLFKFNEKTGLFTIYNHGINYNFHYPHAHAPIYQDTNQNIWLGNSKDLAIQVFNTKSEQWDQQIDLNVEGRSVSQIVQWDDSTIIANVHPYYLAYIHTTTGQVTMSEKISSPFISGSAVIIDPFNGINAMSLENSLIQLQSQKKLIKKSILTYNNQAFPIKDLLYDAQSQQYMLVQRQRGVLLFTDSLFTSKQQYEIPDRRNQFDSLAYPNCLWMDKSQNILWIGTDKGIRKFDLNEKIFMPDSDLKYSKWDEHPIIHITASGTHIWFRSHTILISYDFKSQKFEEYLLNDFEQQMYVLSFAVIGNKIVFATKEGLKIFDQTSKAEIKYKIPEQFNSLKKEFINEVLVEKDTLWIGTNSSGLYKMINQDHSNYEVEQYYQNNHSSSNNINFILPTENHIWTMNSNGYRQFNRSKKESVIFNIDDGFQRTDNSLLRKGHQDILLNPNGYEFQYFKTSEIQNTSSDPYIINLQVNKDRIITSDTSSGHILLNYSQRDLLFEFGALNFGIHNKNFYRCRLLNYNDKWSYLGERNYFNYTNLPSGKYTFEYDAKSLQSHWNKNPKQIHFKIQSHPLARWWFKIIWTLLAVGLLLLIYKYLKDKRDKENKLITLEKERAVAELKALRAQMNPHFLFNTLNSINWYIIQNNPLDASKFLTKFSKLMRMILDNSKLERITLAKELETLELYTEIESVRFDDKFEYQIIVDAAIQQKKYLIPPLLFQPFVENAIWHGLLNKKGPGKVTIQIQKMDQYLLCSVEDNGIGRKASIDLHDRTTERKSRGIEITSERIQSFNGSKRAPIQIIDLKDAQGKSLGTRVQFELPYIP